MNKLRRLVIATVAGLAGLGVAAPSSAETLGDVLAKAYDHNGLLDQNRALLRAADENVAATFALLRPIVAWNGSVNVGDTNARTALGVGTTQTRSAFIGLAAELLLYDNGATNLAVASAEQNVLATRAALVSTEQAVLLNAATAFMNVLRDREIVRLRTNNVRVITRELRAAEDRFEVGEVTRTDVAQSEARLAGSRAQLAGAQGDLLQSEAFFLAAVGSKPGSLVVPTTTPSVPSSLEAATNLSIVQHPSMIQVQREIAAAEINVQRAEAVMGPTISLRATLGATENFNSNNYNHAGTVGLNFNQTIYQGGRLTALLRQSMAQRDERRAFMHVTRHNLRQQTGSAWALLTAAGSQVLAADRQIEASEIAFEGVREEASLGARTTLDVLNAEQELLDARATAVDARAAQLIAVYQVLTATGLMTADHLNLNVEQYDPEAYYNLVRNAPTRASEQGQKLDKVLRALGKE